MTPVILLGCALLLGGCATDWSDPRAVAERYLTAVHQQDLKTAYNHLSAEDRAFRSFEQYRQRESHEESLVVGPLMRQTTFVMETLRVAGDRGQAIARVTRPDLRGVMNDLFSSALTSAASGLSAGEFDRLLKKRYQGRALPTVTVKQGVGLVREPDGWRVAAGWPQEERVNALITRAAGLEASGQLKEAKTIYAEALALNGNLLELQDAMDAIDFRLKPAREAQQDMKTYIDQMLEEKRSRRSHAGRAP